MKKGQTLKEAIREAGLHPEKVGEALDAHLPGDKLTISRVAFQLNANRDDKNREITDKNALLANLAGISQPLADTLRQRLG